MSLRSELTAILLPVSLANIPEIKKEPEKRADIQQAINDLGNSWNKNSINQIVQFMAIIMDRPDLAEYRYGNKTDPVYEPGTILVATKKTGLFSKKGDLFFVIQGIDKEVYNQHGVSNYFDETYGYKPATDIEVRVFYGGITPAFLKVIMADSRMAHYLEPMFDESIEVVDVPDDPPPPPDEPLVAIPRTVSLEETLSALSA